MTAGCKVFLALWLICGITHCDDIPQSNDLHEELGEFKPPDRSSDVSISSSINEDPPNILFIMADDLGWANVGFHNHENEQINTPNIDELARNGLQLNRMYVYRGCAPSRSSFQSGRLPVHVTMDNGDGITNPYHGMV